MTMSSTERVNAVVSGKQADRPPFCLTTSLYGARLTGVSTADYYSKPGLYAAGQRAVADLCEPDIVIGPFAMALEAQAFGSTVENQSKSPPTHSKPALRSASDIRTLDIPEQDNDPGFLYLVESVEMLVSDQHGGRPVAGIITAPCDFPVFMLGLETWIETLLCDPDLAASWNSIALEHFVTLASEYFRVGASFIVSPVMLANPCIIHPDLAKTLVLPLLEEAFARVPGPIVYHHGGNSLASSLDSVKTLPNVLGVLIGEADSMSVSRRNLGPDTLLLGNISGPQLNRRTPDDIQARASRLLNERRGDEHFILASADADIPFDSDPECLMALRRAIDGYS